MAGMICSLLSDAAMTSVFADANISPRSASSKDRLKAIVAFSSDTDDVDSTNEDELFLKQQSRGRKLFKKRVYNIRRECRILLILTGIIGVLIFATLFFQWLIGHSDDVQKKKHLSVPIRNLLAFTSPYDPPISNTSLNSNTCNINDTALATVPNRCNLVHLQLLARHGSRNPIELQSNKNINLLELQQLAQRDICRYGKWLNGRSGLSDKEAAAARHQQAWYASSSIQRCIDSANAYASVFSGKTLPQSVMHIIPLNRDRVLSIGGGCHKWFSQVPYANHYLPNILELLSTRIGFKIKKDMLDALGELCAFDYIKENRQDHWCQLLLSKENRLLGELATDASDKQFPVKDPSPLEYYDFITDIEYYHRCGALHSNNKRISCGLFTQMINEMQQAIHGHLPLRWRLRFGHGETILLLLNHLNLYTETPTFDQHRAFRTSRISPFAANIHFELLKCTSGNNNDKDAQGYFVRMLHNERPVQIPGCPADNILCPWKQFYKVAQMRIGHCDMNEICGPE
ncbi:histidine phosphatase superfamily [Syncephalis fuscata]|nr:histidine phosphatase superfamily [Syncephalis fuscata]